MRATLIYQDDDAVRRPVPGFLRSVRTRAGAVWISGEQQAPEPLGTYVARWTGSAWEPHVIDAATYPDDAGEGWDLALTAGGERVSDGNTVWQRTGATWGVDHDRFSGDPTRSPVEYRALAVVGAAVYVAGAWQSRPFGTPPHPVYLPYWDGAAWGPVALPGITDDQAWLINQMDVSPAGTVWFAGCRAASEAGQPAWRGNLTTGGTLDSANGSLKSIRAFADDDVWAAGGTAGGAPLIQHWDGAAWTTLGSLPPTPLGTVLHGIGGTSASDVWVCGESHGTPWTPRVWHWDGGAWAIHDLSAVLEGTAGYVLYAVTAVGLHDVWVVGLYGVSSSNQLSAWHWDGAAWTNQSPRTT